MKGEHPYRRARRLGISSNLKLLGEGSVKLHGSVQLIFGVGFAPQELLNQGRLGLRQDENLPRSGLVQSLD